MATSVYERVLGGWSGKWIQLGFDVLIDNCLLIVTHPLCVSVGPRSVNLSTGEYHVHEVSTVLKRFLRTLDDPVLTGALYQHWITASRMSPHSLTYLLIDQDGCGSLYQHWITASRMSPHSPTYLLTDLDVKMVPYASLYILILETYCGFAENAFVCLTLTLTLDGCGWDVDCCQWLVTERQHQLSCCCRRQRRRRPGCIDTLCKRSLTDLKTELIENVTERM